MFVHKYYFVNYELKVLQTIHEYLDERKHKSPLEIITP